MTTKILTLTLLATALAFSSVIPKEQTRTSKQQSNSISTQIAYTLVKRGIDDDKALQIAQNFISENEELFFIMVSNYLHHTNIKREALFNELSKLALLRKKADFTSYSFLIKLTQSLKKTQLNSDNLKKLAAISTNNSLLQKVFV
ncbi:hypothetical protein JHD49_01995 [Sulfurimonas sp. SAG-AH-194-C21]|nr:hypothetical protein [Sulfurimonas sp. SAG-AH-194-C21]MDF1882706.1 hypothetical protein [Sulfurimonas sp. SAG-AH-194-C21]